MNDDDLADVVLDASALLAFVHGENGADRVRRALPRGALMSTVNWAEVVSDLAEHGEAVEQAVARVKTSVAKAGTLELIAFDDIQAEQAARLRTATRALGLSLADRACLALGRLRRLPVLTTDRAWRSLHLSIKIEIIR